MAGHSQFKNIMHRKGAQDAKRAKIFTKIIREIVTAVKSGLPDPNTNPRLRAAIAWAREENMPKDKIEAAVKKATSGTDTDNYEEVRYEGYGIGGVAVIVEALTDNRNRTAPEVRAAFTKFGGNLGETGSVSFMFDRVGKGGVGQIRFPLKVASEEQMFEAAIEAGAEGVETGENGHEITCQPDNLHEVRDFLTAKFGDAESAKFVWLPKNTSPIGEEQAINLFKMIDMLEDNDDVQNVYSNVEVSEEVMQRLSA